MALHGCINCGLVLEAETDRETGHLTGKSCPDCGSLLRAIDLAEAEQLTRERFLAAHWREVAHKKSSRR